MMQFADIINLLQIHSISIINIIILNSHRKRPIHIPIFDKKVSLGWIYIAITQSLFIAVVKKQSRLKELEQIITPLSELVRYDRFN